MMGIVMGCVIVFCVFWLFYKLFDVGVINGVYLVFYMFMYCNMVIMGVDGLFFLKYCLMLFYIFFVVVFVVNMVKDLVLKKVVKFIFIFMVVVIFFYVGVYFIIDMFLGCMMFFIWEMSNKVEVDLFGLVVVLGCMCGDGFWVLFEVIFFFVNVKFFICMKFLLSFVNVSVDFFFGN